MFEEIAGPGKLAVELPPATAATMREQLKQAIALEPTFSEAYRLLAFVYLVTNENLSEAEKLLTQAMQLNPGRDELGYTLGQVYLRQQKFDEARQTLEPVAKYAAEPKLREQATVLLESVSRMAAAYTRYAPDQLRNAVAAKASEVKETIITPRPSLRRRFDGEKTEGLLLKMDCANGLTVTVKGAKDIWQFHAAAPDRVQFVTFTQETAEPLACGALKTPLRVVVTYRYNTDAKAGNDGELIAVEFVKESEK